MDVERVRSLNKYNNWQQIILKILCHLFALCWSRWTCCLWRWCAAARFLGSRVRIPLRAYIFVYSVYCVLFRQRPVRRLPRLRKGNTSTLSEYFYGMIRNNFKPLHKLTFRRRIKSHLPFAGIIRRLPYSTLFQDKG